MSPPPPPVSHHHILRLPPIVIVPRRPSSSSPTLIPLASPVPLAPFPHASQHPNLPVFPCTASPRRQDRKSRSSKRHSQIPGRHLQPFTHCYVQPWSNKDLLSINSRGLVHRFVPGIRHILCHRRLLLYISRSDRCSIEPSHRTIVVASRQPSSS